MVGKGIGEGLTLSSILTHVLAVEADLTSIPDSILTEFTLTISSGWATPCQEAVRMPSGP